MLMSEVNSCEDCLHRIVCNRKEKVEKVKNDVRRLLGEYDDSIEISVRCKHYEFNYGHVRTMGPCELANALYGDINYTRKLVKKKHSK